MLTPFKGPLKNPNILTNFSSPSDRCVFDTNVVADQKDARLSWLRIIDGFSLPYRKVIVNLPRVEQIENFWEFFFGSECSEQVNKTDILILVVDQSCCITRNLYCLSIISSLHSSNLLDWPGITFDWSPMRINFRSMLEVSQKKNELLLYYIISFSCNDE